MEYRPARCDDEIFPVYVAFFRRCFPHASHYSVDYLRWLYRENPAGPVFGYDAYDGDHLAAHYVCVPAALNIEGVAVPGALSLDTATHPDYQGRGLFAKLATMTYERSAELGHRAVIGVANRNSTPGMVRRLGFQVPCALSAKIGIGSLGVDDWNAVNSVASLRRTWTPELLTWRLRNPSNPVTAKRLRRGTLGFLARTFVPGIACWTERPNSDLPLPAEQGSAVTHLARVFIGCFPARTPKSRGYVEIPDRLRRAPLNFVYRPLAGAPASIDGRQLLFDFLDFDAF